VHLSIVRPSYFRKAFETTLRTTNYREELLPTMKLNVDLALMPVQAVLLLVLPATTYALDVSGHEWIPKGPEDARSPCPALNTLANHGYIYRNGKDIPLDVIAQAGEDVFSIAFDAVKWIADGARYAGVEFGELPDGSPALTLSDVFAHNKGEHDSSIVRPDEFFEPHANRSEELIDGLMSMNPTSDFLFPEDISAFQKSRIMDSRLNTPDHVPHTDPGRQGQLASEGSLIMNVGNSTNLEKISKAALREWFTYERIPEFHTTRMERGLDPVDLQTDISYEMRGFFLVGVTEAVNAPLEEAPTKMPGVEAPTASSAGMSASDMPAQQMIIVAPLVIGVFNALI